MSEHPQGGIVYVGRKKKKVPPKPRPKPRQRASLKDEKRMSQPNVSFGGKPSDAINPSKPKGSGMSFGESVRKLKRALGGKKK